MNAPEPTPFKPRWPEADMRLLRPNYPRPPHLPMADVLSPKAVKWVEAAAEGAGAPADYVPAALLSATGALIENARWVSLWRGWAEPPILWTMCIGNPSSGKSPAIDAVLATVRRAKRPMRQKAEAETAAWEKKARTALDQGSRSSAWAERR